MMGILRRFVIVTLILIAPILLLPRLLTLVRKLTKSDQIFGQLVRVKTSIHSKLDEFVAWCLRPLQGIALSMVFAEKFLELLEFSVGSSYAGVLARLILFVVGSALVSLFLSAIWMLDDLGVMAYNKKTGELRMAGSIVGIALPLVSGAIGVSSLFHRSSAIEALTDLVGITMVLYPPYMLFVMAHHEFVRRRSDVLLEKLQPKSIETKVL
jgi:hypothetical protein